MKWQISPGWPNGNRWDLIDDTGMPEGRVIRLSGKKVIDVCKFGQDSGESSFETMKEAAQWLVKKVTSGTGAQ